MINPCAQNRRGSSGQKNFWRRPVEARVPTGSRATFAGPDRLRARLRISPPSLLESAASRSKKPSTFCTCWVFSSGDVLLSRGLSPYYHWGCSVSLPCSEWERVVPLRYCHQKRTAKASPFASGELKISDVDCRLSHSQRQRLQQDRYCHFKELDCKSSI